MRHRVDHRKLNRTASHRKAMLCNMVTSLFASERITTTDAKAKEARRLAERLITRARKGYNAHQEALSLKEAAKVDEARQMEAVALAHWRQAARYVRKLNVLRKLFEVIAPQYLERDGGYTRIVKMNHRLGDNAKTVLLELVDIGSTGKRGSKKAEEEADADAKKTPSKKAKTSKSAEPKTKAKAKGKAKGKSKSKTKDEDAGKSDKSKKKTKSKPSSKSKSKSKTSGKKASEGKV